MAYLLEQRLSELGKRAVCNAALDELLRGRINRLHAGRGGLRIERLDLRVRDAVRAVELGHLAENDVTQSFAQGFFYKAPAPKPHQLHPPAFVVQRCR